MGYDSLSKTGFVLVYNTNILHHYCRLEAGRIMLETSTLLHPRSKALPRRLLTLRGCDRNGSDGVFSETAVLICTKSLEQATAYTNTEYWYEVSSNSSTFSTVTPQFDIHSFL